MINEKNIFQPESVEVNLEEEEKINEIIEELDSYGKEQGLRGLEDRIQRGLDPAGMLAVGKTREKIEKAAESLGASFEDVVKLTKELHVGAIWQYADELAKGERPDIRVWTIAGEVTVRGKEKEGDLTKKEFLQDLERVNELLDKAINDPEAFAKEAKENLINRSKEQFILEDEVPVSELDSGFLAMAVNGYKSGIVKSKEGLLFVGASELDYRVLETAGLKVLEKEDRGRKSLFFIDKEGNEVVKKLYPGFAIVLNGDLEIAKELARTVMEESEEE